MNPPPDDSAHSPQAHGGYLEFLTIIASSSSSFPSFVLCRCGDCFTFGWTVIYDWQMVFALIRLNKRTDTPRERCVCWLLCDILIVCPFDCNHFRRFVSHRIFGHFAVDRVIAGHAFLMHVVNNWRRTEASR